MTESKTAVPRMELHKFAEDAGLTIEQVLAEITSGRLTFDVDDSGAVYTDVFAALDWINRRLAALSHLGIKGVAFPVYPCDMRSIEWLPDSSRVNLDALHQPANN